METNGGNAAGSTPSTNGQSQPANPGSGFSIPDGHALVRKDEYDSYRRQAEQYNGVKPYWEAGSKYGFKSADDFSKREPWFKQFDTLEKRGIKPDMLERMFSGEADQDLGRGEKPDFDPEKFSRELESKFEQKMAAKEWEAMTAKEKDYVDSALRDYFGDDEVDDMTKTVYRSAVERFLDTNRSLYEKGHPLYETHLKPHDESIAKKAVEYFKKMKNDSAGKSAAAKADAVIASDKKPASSSAGKGGTSGAPTTNKKTNPHDPHDDAALERAVAARKAARAAGVRS